MMKVFKKQFSVAGYSVTFEIEENETQGWLSGPRGMSSSVACAMDTGESSDSNERPWPKKVLSELEKFCEEVGY